MTDKAVAWIGFQKALTGRIPKVTVEVRGGSAKADATVKEAQEEVARRTQ